jgi:hypothetical protein
MIRGKNIDFDIDSSIVGIKKSLSGIIVNMFMPYFYEVGEQKNMGLFLLGFGTFLTLSQNINVGEKYLKMA